MIFDMCARNSLEERQPFQQMVQEQLYLKEKGKKNLNLNLMSYTKISSKHIIHLNVKCKIINFQRKPSKLRTRHRILRLDTKSTIHKRKNGHTDLIKIRNFCSVRCPMKRMKRQATEQEKIFANHILDKEFVSRIYKEPSKLNSKKKSNQKMGKRQTDVSPKTIYEWSISK